LRDIFLSNVRAWPGFFNGMHYWPHAFLAWEAALFWLHLGEIMSTLVRGVVRGESVFQGNLKLSHPTPDQFGLASNTSSLKAPPGLYKRRARSDCVQSRGRSEQKPPGQTKENSWQFF
jgi:hypothetical protein